MTSSIRPVAGRGRDGPSSHYKYAMLGSKDNKLVTTAGVPTGEKKAFRRQQSSIEWLSNFSGIDEQAWYSTYSSTLVLLLVVHALYLRQILARKHSRRSLVVNYNRLIQRKQFHEAIWAILNHAPTKANTMPTPESSAEETPRSTAMQSGNVAEGMPSHGTYQTCTPQSIGGLVIFGKDWIFGPGKKLSGLPLLFYCAHILWSIRSLEVAMGSGWGYARFLWTMTWTGLALDLGFTYLALTTLREMNYGRSAPFATRFWATSSTANPAVARQVEFALVRRSVGGATITTCAAIFVFRELFDVPIPVVPFLSTQLPVLDNPSISLFFIIVALLVLSHPTHPVAGVSCGTCAAVLWTSGCTTFLVEPYWSNGSIVVYVILCVMACKANNSAYLPCIDSVPWNCRGELICDSNSSNHYDQVLSRSIPTQRDDYGLMPSFPGEDDMSSQNSVVDDLSVSTEPTTMHRQQRISSSSLDFMVDEGTDVDEEAPLPYQSLGRNDNTSLIASSNQSTSNAGLTMRSRRVPAAPTT